MDYLDPKKQKMHHISVFVGYAIVTVMIALTVWLLFNQAGGFGLDKNGNVVQSGLLFMSSTPAGADIRLNNSLNPNQTNVRLSVLSGQYKVQLSRSGYRPWSQSLSLYGGSIERYDYPFLIPQKVDTSALREAYTAPPVLASQSPDQRWLLIQPTAEPTFELYDLKATKPVATSLTLPADVVTAGTTQTWKAVEWADDNRHVLLQHDHDAKTEFISLDRLAPHTSVNVSKLTGSTATKAEYQNGKFDHYFLYTADSQTLSTASVSAPQPVTLLDHVLSYKTYGNDMVMFASSQSITADKTPILVLQDGKQYLLREVPASPAGYVMDFTQYSGTWYMVFGAVSDSRVYIYKDPIGQIRSKNGAAIASYVLRTPNPAYVGFSSNARFIVDENGSQFAVFDAEKESAYNYNTGRPLDSPQPHALWMDGYHLTYVSNGQLQLVDFDGTNPQSLVAANPAYQPFYTANSKAVVTLAPASNNGTSLQSSWLRTSRDR